MKRKENRKPRRRGVSDEVLGKLNKAIPGIRGLFKSAERTKTFGPRVKEIRKEIERRFGKK